MASSSMQLNYLDTMKLIDFTSNQDTLDSDIERISGQKMVDTLFFDEMRLFFLNLAQVYVCNKIYSRVLYHVEFESRKLEIGYQQIVSVAKKIESTKKDFMHKKFYKQDTTPQQKYQLVIDAVTKQFSAGMTEVNIANAIKSVDDTIKLILVAPNNILLFVDTLLNFIASSRLQLKIGISILKNYILYSYGSKSVREKIEKNSIPYSLEELKNILEEDKQLAVTPTVEEKKSALLSKPSPIPFLNRIKECPPINHPEEAKAIFSDLSTNAFACIEQLIIGVMRLNHFPLALSILNIFFDNEGITLKKLKEHAPKMGMSTPKINDSVLKEELKKRRVFLANHPITNHPRLLASFDNDNLIFELVAYIAIHEKKGYACAAMYLREFCRAQLEATVFSEKLAASETGIVLTDKKDEEKKEAPSSEEDLEKKMISQMLFKSEEEMLHRLPHDRSPIAEKHPEADRLMHVMVTILRTGNISAAITLLNHFKNIPETKDVLANETIIRDQLIKGKKWITECATDFHAEITSPDSFLYSVRHKHLPRYFNSPEKLGGLENKINTQLAFSSTDQKKTILAAFQTLYQTPYNIEALVKALVDEKIPIQIMVFVLHEYLMIVFANKHTDYPMPKMTPDPSLASSSSHKMITTTLHEGSRPAKKEKKPAIPTETRENKNFEANNPPASSSEYKKSFNLKYNPEFLDDNDDNFLTFKKSYVKMTQLLKHKKYQHDDLRKAFNKLTSFRQYLFLVRDNAKNRYIEAEICAYLQQFDSSYATEITHLLAQSYIQQGKLNHALKKLNFAIAEYPANECINTSKKELLEIINKKNSQRTTASATSSAGLSVPRPKKEKMEFKIPPDPLFLSPFDKKFLKFKTSVNKLITSKQKQEDLEEAHDAFVLFRSYIVRDTDSLIESDEHEKCAKTYLATLNSTYFTDILFLQAHCFLKKGDVKNAVKTLNTARRFRTLDHRFELQILRLLKKHLSETGHPTKIHQSIVEVGDYFLAKKFPPDTLNEKEGAEVYHILADSLFAMDKKADAKTCYEIALDFDPASFEIQEKLRTMTMAAEGKEELKENKVENTERSITKMIFDLKMGNIEQCEKVACHALQKGQQLLATNPEESIIQLKFAILMFQQVNALMTAESSRLEENSVENIVLMDKRDHLIARAKAEATWLLTQYQSLDNLQEQELVDMRRFIDNSTRYATPEDEKSHPIILSLKESERNVSLKLRDLASTACIQIAGTRP